MAGILHIIDAETSTNALCQLAALLERGDCVISVGPTTIPGWLAIPARRVRKPLGLATLAGWTAGELGNETQAVHAWSLPAAQTGEAIARRTDCALLIHLPHFPPTGELDRLAMLISSPRVLLTVPTRDCRSRLEAAGIDASRVHVLPAASTAIQGRDALRERVRTALGLGDEQQLILAPGSLMRQAGHKYACWVFAVLREVRDDLRLLIPGDGPAMRSLRYFVSTLGYDKEIFMPADRLSPQEALAAADLAAFLPLGDCPLVSLAAVLAAGLPTVAWATADVRELTGEGQAAVLCPVNSVRAASAAMLRMLQDRSAAKATSRAATAWAESHLSVAAMQTALKGLRRPYPQVASP